MPARHANIQKNAGALVEMMEARGDRYAMPSPSSARPGGFGKLITPEAKHTG